MDASLFEKARSKKLRLYVEYPSYLPGLELGSPRGTHWERAVISSDAFSPALQKLRILAIHDCRFVTMKAENPDIVIARIAGFDSAVYGLPKETFPVLIEISQPAEEGSCWFQQQIKSIHNSPLCPCRCMAGNMETYIMASARRKILN